MIASQRKAHKFIWLGISIVIPVLLFFTIKNLDFSATGDTPNGENQFQVRLHEDRTIFIQLNKPLQDPSAIVYEIDSKGNLGKVLGQFTGKKEYQFTLSEKAKGVSVVDKIKNQKIYTTTF